MLQSLPTELRQEILSYIIPAGRGQLIKLYLRDYPYSLKKNEFRYGKHNSDGHDFVYLFPVSRQLLQDAVQIYYGTRTFYLEYGLRHQHEERYHGTSRSTGDALRTDSLSLIPGYALSVVKHLHILVRDDISDAGTHRRVRKVLESFASKLAGGHSLRSLEVFVSNVERFWDINKHFPNASCYQHRFEAPLPEAEALRYGYVLEPLAVIHGIGSVIIKGTNPDFDSKLQTVLSSATKTKLKALRCTAKAATKERTTRNRVVKRSTTASERSKKFYDPVYDWSRI